MTVLDDIANQLDKKCLVQCLHDNCCCLSMDGLDDSQYLLIYLEGEGSPIPNTVTHCDYLFIGFKPDCSSLWVVPVELSAGRKKRLGVVVEQLEAGATLADSLIPTDADIDLQFMPVAAAPFSVARIRALKREFNPIRFREGSGDIFAALKCGDRLIDALQ